MSGIREIDEATLLASALDAQVLAGRGESAAKAYDLDAELATLVQLADLCCSTGGDLDAAPSASIDVRRRLVSAMRESRLAGSRNQGSGARLVRGSWRGAVRMRLLAPALVILLMVPVLAVGQSNTSAGRVLRSAAAQAGVLPPWLHHQRARDVARERPPARRAPKPPLHRQNPGPRHLAPGSVRPLARPHLLARFARPAPRPQRSARPQTQRSERPVRPDAPPPVNGGNDGSNGNGENAVTSDDGTGQGNAAPAAAQPAPAQSGDGTRADAPTERAAPPPPVRSAGAEPSNSPAPVRPAPPVPNGTTGTNHDGAGANGDGNAGSDASSQAAPAA